MGSWKRLERRGGHRAEQHIVTVAAYAQRNRNRPPQVNMLIGAQIVRELGWGPGPFDIEANVADCLLRVKPSAGKGSANASQKKDAGTLTLSLPVTGQMEPHKTAACEPWMQGDWLVLQVPSWLSSAMGDAPRRPLRRLPEGAVPSPQGEKAAEEAARPVTKPAQPPAAAADPPPPPPAAEPVRTASVPAKEPAARRAPAAPAAPPAAPAPPAPSKPAEPPAQDPSPGRAPTGHHPLRASVLKRLWPNKLLGTTTIRAKVNEQVADLPHFETNAALAAYATWLGLGPQGSAEKPNAEQAPPGHSKAREDALRTAWPMAHIAIENLRQIVNSKTAGLPRFDLKGLQAYAAWLGLGERPAAQPPQARPSSIAARAEILAKSKERQEAEQDFAAGKSVREVADDFGLGIGTVSMWHFEWQQEQARAKAGSAQA